MMAQHRHPTVWTLPGPPLPRIRPHSPPPRKPEGGGARAAPAATPPRPTRTQGRSATSLGARAAGGRDAVTCGGLGRCPPRRCSWQPSQGHSGGRARGPGDSSRHAPRRAHAWRRRRRPRAPPPAAPRPPPGECGHSASQRKLWGVTRPGRLCKTQLT